MAFAKADRASSWFDKAKDFLAVFIGGQRSAVLADNLADTITNSLKVMPVGAIRDQMAQSIGDILGTTDLSEEGIAKVLVKLTDSLSDKELLKLSIVS